MFLETFIAIFYFRFCLANAETNPAQMLLSPSLYQSGSDSVAELLSLHQNLSRIPSTTGDEKDVADFLVTYLTLNNFMVEKQLVDEQLDRYNIWAWPGHERGTKTLLTTHIDTVPPFIPYSRTEDGKIKGRGTVDAKSCIASQIIAVSSLARRALLPPSSVSLLFVVGEETNGEGMRKASSLERQFSSVIFGEPTEGALGCGHKGLLIFKIFVEGKAAHSGYPWLGFSATRGLAKAMTALLELEPKLPASKKFGRSTVNIGQIEGGVAPNVIAEEASASVAIRLASGTPEEVKEMILTALVETRNDTQTGGGTFDLEWLNEAYGPVDIDCDVPDFKQTVLNYGTDIPQLKGQHKRYLYGPGSILVAHSKNEYVASEALVKAVKDYEILLLHTLSNQ